VVRSFELGELPLEAVGANVVALNFAAPTPWLNPSSDEGEVIARSRVPIENVPDSEERGLMAQS